jgi:hypothetical protein
MGGVYPSLAGNMPMRISLCRLLAAGCLSLPLPALAARYDGVWVVDGTTDVGDCLKAFHGTVRVEHDDIVGTDAGASVSYGHIEKTGTAWAHFERGSEIVRAQGKFSGISASGAWSSNTAYCGGRWHARRMP